MPKGPQGQKPPAKQILWLAILIAILAFGYYTLTASFAQP